MATYYIDWEGGNDSNDGTSFANRKKTQYGFENVSVTGGDEIRFAGKPRQLIDSSARIWNWFGWRPYSYRSISNINYSTTTGQTSMQVTGHGMQTGETIAIDSNNNNSNVWESINGIWEVTVDNANTFRLNDYTAPNSNTGQSGGYFRKMKSSVIQLSSELTQEIASNGQRSGPWTANGGTITTSLETTTSTWGSQVPMQSHMYSDKIDIPSGFGTGLCAYWATGSLNLSGYQQISYLMRQNSGTRSPISSPTISLRLCTDTQGATSVHTIPLITGADSSNNWRDFTHDFGTNLNSGIQSIALYIDSDVGARSFNFDNIIACKAKSAADSLTLNSLVGLGTQPSCPQYYKISSIRKKSIRLLLNDRHYSRYPFGYYCPSGVDWSGAVGIARTANTYSTVNMYKIEPTQLVDDMSIEPNASSWGSFSPDWFRMSSKSGISTTSRLKISGGWDTSSSMESQHTGGYSALNGHNSYGYLLKFHSCSYTEISNFIGASALTPIELSSCSYSQFNDLGGVAGGYYAFMLSSCHKLMGGCNIWGSLGQYALQAGSNNNWNEYKDQNVGLTTFTFGPSLGSAIYFSSGINSDIHKIKVHHAAQSYVMEIYGCSASRYHNIDMGDSPYGGSTSYGLRMSNSNGMTVGICTIRNTYYTMRNENTPGVVFDLFDVIAEDTSLEHGSNGSNNVQYAMYNGSNSDCKILGGTWDKMPYMDGSDIFTDNVVFNDTNNPTFSKPNRLLCKNFDGNNSGEYKNFYQYGHVLPDTSTRHTASGFSWKIDVSSSSAIKSAPIEWEVAKVICNANAQVTASIWVYRDGTGVNGGIRVKASAIGGVGTSNIDAEISDTTVNSWVQCSLTFTPNEPGTVAIYAMGYIPSSGGSTSHNVWLDDFSVTQA
jgi:hypothetical protein